MQMNRQTAIVTRKGRITIPQEIRQRLDLHEGDRVEFVIDGEHTLVCRFHEDPNPFAQYIGALPAFNSKTDINAWMEDLRAEETSAD
jgi:AbrB family looped-hinge helix DNA binding protein